MNHPIYKVVSYEIVAPYTIQIGFNDNSIRIINFQSILVGEMYGPLNNIDLFNQVTIDPEVQTLVWTNGPDFDPATLHDWEQHLLEMQSQMKTWKVLA